MRCALWAFLAAACLLSGCEKADDIAMPEDVSVGMSEKLVLKRVRQICPICTFDEQKDMVDITGFPVGRFGEAAMTLRIHHSSDVILKSVVTFWYKDKRGAQQVYGDFVGAQSTPGWTAKTGKDAICMVQVIENRLNSICFVDLKDGPAVMIANQFGSLRFANPKS